MAKEFTIDWNIAKVDELPLASYACPHCQTPSAQMRVSDERMEPTAEQRAAHPEHDLVGHEILICACGEPLTWYDLKEVEGTTLVAQRGANWETIDQQMREEIRNKELENLQSLQQNMEVGARAGAEFRGMMKGSEVEAEGHKTFLRQLQPGESSRQAMADLGMVLDVERLPKNLAKFDETMKRHETREFKDYNLWPRSITPLADLVATLRHRLTELWPEDEISVEPDVMNRRAVVRMEFTVLNQKCGVMFNTPSILGSTVQELVEYAVAEIQAARRELESKIQQR